MRAFFAALILCAFASLPARAQYDNGAVYSKDWAACRGDNDCMIPVPGAQYAHGYEALEPSPKQPGAQPNKGFDVSVGQAAWMKSLQQPNQPSSCCGPADAYPVEIIEDGGTDHVWRVRVTDGRPYKYPDGTVRPYLPTGTEFQSLPGHVTKPKQGNPMNSAWIFVAVSSIYHTVFIYCVVPLPPSF